MCFGRKPADPEFRKNEDIEKALRNDRKRAEREVKLLLLGMAPPKLRHALQLTQDDRCRREWQVDGAQANAHYQCWRIRKVRTQDMASDHL